MVKCSGFELQEVIHQRKKNKPLKKKEPEAHNEVADLPAAPSEVLEVIEVPAPSVEAQGEVELTASLTEV